MSRSIRNVRTSRRRRPNSSRSSVVRLPAGPPPASTAACRTQARTALSVRSSSCATTPIDFPLSRTNRTVWVLNSSVNARRFRLAISHSYRTLRAIKSVYETGAGPVEAMRSLPAGAILPATADVSLPSSVQQAIVRRLDQLTKNARRLVAVAAAIGRDFDFRLMVRAAGLPEAAATEAVEELVRRHIFQGQGDRFAFIHHRVREVMYSRLLAPRRRMVHREIAEALETLYRANLEPHVEALGLHYHQGEIWHKAIGYLRAAARTAAAHAAYREATAYLDRALMCARHLPDERETGTLAIDLRVDLSRSLLALGEVPRLFDILREAETLVKALEDPRRLGRVWAAMAQYFLLVGQPERAVEMGNVRSPRRSSWATRPSRATRTTDWVKPIGLEASIVKAPDG